MAKELELAAVDGTSSLFGRHHHWQAQPGAVCANCHTVLGGRYCHTCGQSADNHHRSILHLLFEAIEGLFHLDGRLWRTLPLIFFRPGTLTKDYMEGRIARHVPPLRTFLVSLLLLIFAAEGAVHKQTHSLKPPTSAHDSGPKAENRLDIPKQDFQLAFGPAGPSGPSEKATNWIETQVEKALKNSDYYTMIVFSWGHRLAILLLPIMAGLLTVLYFYKRRIFIYDHLLVSMNMLSFLFLGLALAMVLPSGFAGPFMGVFTVWVPVNIFMTLRGAYGSSVFGAVVKTLLLWISSFVAFGLMILTLLAVGLTQI